MQAAYQDFFAGKKITVMGLGLLGRGVGDIEFMASCGAAITVTDLKSPEDLSASVEKLKHLPDIEFVLGQHRHEDFQNCDMVIKAAGVPLNSSYIEEAKGNGIPVYMSTALFAKLFGARIVGVTGTRGKSTVTQLIYEGLVAAGKPAHLGGNVRGKSTLAMLPDVGPDDIIVLELDSWQLQGFRDLGISPHIAVFTNLMPDHMNYYGDDMDLYFHDKAGIFENQKQGDVLIAGDEISAKIKPAGEMIVPPPLPDDWAVAIPGAHNRLNAAYALEALRRLDVADDVSRKVFAEYAGLEGRLDLLAEIDGVKFYNDSNATTPEAAIAALHSFDKGKILLIAGGADKGLELEHLAQEIPACCRKAVFLKGAGTDRLLKLLPDFPVHDSLQSAFDAIVADAHAGDIVLLSPAFASFGMFKNEYDRGDQFKDIVTAYQEGKKA